MAKRRSTKRRKSVKRRRRSIKRRKSIKRRRSTTLRQYDDYSKTITDTYTKKKYHKWKDIYIRYERDKVYILFIIGALEGDGSYIFEWKSGRWHTGLSETVGKDAVRWFVGVDDMRVYEGYGGYSYGERLWDLSLYDKGALSLVLDPMEGKQLNMPHINLDLSKTLPPYLLKQVKSHVPDIFRREDTFSL